MKKTENDLIWERKSLEYQKRNHLEKIYSRLEFGHYDMANELIKNLMKINEELSLLKKSTHP